MTEAAQRRPPGWSALLDAHPLAHFVYDPTSLRLWQANAAALARYGYSRAEFLALRRSDLLQPAEIPALQRFLAELPGDGVANVHRIWLERTKDGRMLHAEMRGMAVDFDGQPARLVVIVDASGRHRMAAAAAHARDLLAVAGRMAQLGGWRLDVKTRRASGSDEFCAIHEVPQGTELKLDQVADFYPGEAAQALTHAFGRCIAQGEAFDLELPFVSAGGTPRFVRLVGAAVRDAVGGVVAIEGALQDLTERHQAAAALTDSRARLAGLLRAMPDLWFVFDAEMRYIEVSHAEHPALNRPWEDKIGRSIDDTLNADLAAEVRRLVVAAHASGQPQSHDYQLEVPPGELRAFEGRFVPLSEGRTLKLIRDVTEARELQGRFRSMAEAAPIGIFMTDAAGEATYVNPAWQQLYGIDGESALNQGWAAALHPDDHARVFAAWLEAAQSAQALEAEFRLRRGDGSERTVLVRSRPLRDARGRVEGHVGTSIDVTQARELEAARRAQAVAEEAGQRQAAFMSRVSHELRTPLNAILGFSQLLEQSEALAAARAQVFAGHVRRAGEHMLMLVDDLLELQRLEHPGQQVATVALELAPVLMACVELLRPAAATAGLELCVQAAAGLRATTDERCLRQILLNLGSNAIKYGRVEGVRSAVVLAARAAAGRVQVTVTDSGPGMTGAQLERLFQPFERLSQATGPQPGTGLGLVITRQLAHSVAGEVTIESQPGHGTVATLSLPA